MPTGIDKALEILRTEEKADSLEHSHFTIRLGEMTLKNDVQFYQIRDAVRQIDGVKVAELIDLGEDNEVGVDVFTNRPLLFQIIGRHVIDQITG